MKAIIEKIKELLTEFNPNELEVRYDSVTTGYYIMFISDSGERYPLTIDIDFDPVDRNTLSSMLEEIGCSYEWTNL